jgi:hypothetical protein
VQVSKCKGGNALYRVLGPLYRLFGPLYRLFGALYRLIGLGEQALGFGLSGFVAAGAASLGVCCRPCCNLQMFDHGEIASLRLLLVLYFTRLRLLLQLLKKARPHNTREMMASFAIEKAAARIAPKRREEAFEPRLSRASFAVPPPR